MLPKHDLNVIIYVFYLWKNNPFACKAKGTVTCQQDLTSFCMLFVVMARHFLRVTGKENMNKEIKPVVMETNSPRMRGWMNSLLRTFYFLILSQKRHISLGNHKGYLKTFTAYIFLIQFSYFLVILRLWIYCIT